MDLEDLNALKALESVIACRIDGEYRNAVVSRPNLGISRWIFGGTVCELGPSTGFAWLTGDFILCSGFQKEKLLMAF